jgi:hypothetical protein
MDRPGRGLCDLGPWGILHSPPFYTKEHRGALVIPRGGSWKEAEVLTSVGSVTTASLTSSTQVPGVTSFQNKFQEGDGAGREPGDKALAQVPSTAGRLLSEPQLVAVGQG